ncbi:MAG: hypothetical protein IJ766_08205 [Clostridia bacterium]|nr:hypothetical protein [Clostridia bacterium]
MPKEDEIDILKGLASGAKAFSKSAEEKELIVFSSGISTEGVLNFAEHPDWIEKKPSEIVDMLDQTKSLPDLSDVHITWYGFGDVEGAQKELSDFNYYRLKNIWKAILEASGVRDAASVFDDMLAIEDESAEAPKEYPPVTPVDFPEMIVIDEKDIGFVRDSANFSDEQKAIDALEYYAQCINDIGHTFYIVGTTATADTIENCFLCSQERADAVKKILCESYNVPEALLQTYALGQINLGGEYAWRYADLDGNNKLIPDIAQKNRRVMLIDATSETGQKFLQDWTSGDIAKS